MRSILIVGAMAAMLAGCQTAQESMADAEITCESQGFRPGTRAYQQCRSANYVENRRASQRGRQRCRGRRRGRRRGRCPDRSPTTAPIMAVAITAVAATGGKLDTARSKPGVPPW